MPDLPLDTPKSSPKSDVAQLQQLHAAAASIRAELGRIIVGQHQTIEELLIALVSGGHCLLVGVPGLAKTLMISSLAKVLDLDYKRIQFTPDLMPSDITGTEILKTDAATGERRFEFVRGPVFANLLLADEINRAPPKTQAALLESMQEGQVTAGGHPYRLPIPFIVLATQNPIEQEGTYPLPEAQLDRFMMQVAIGYPTEEEELDILLQDRSTVELSSGLVSSEQLLSFPPLVSRIPMTESVARYIMRIVRASRPEVTNSQQIAWGAGPRGGQFLATAAKAHAAIHGQNVVSFENVNATAHCVLRHRIRPSFQAASDGWDADRIIDDLVIRARKAT